MSLLTILTRPTRRTLPSLAKSRKYITTTAPKRPRLNITQQEQQTISSTNTNTTTTTINTFINPPITPNIPHITKRRKISTTTTTNKILTPLQRTLKSTLTSLIKSKFPPEYWRKKDESQSDPAEFHAAIAEAGYLGVCVPESLGGSGLGISEATVVMQAVTGAGGGMAGAQCVHGNLYGIVPVVGAALREGLGLGSLENGVGREGRGGGEGEGYEKKKKKKEWIQNVISGKWRVCFGVTEPDAGLDTKKIRTRAVRERDPEAQGGYVYKVSGNKVWITCAGVADRMVLLARTEGDGAGGGGAADGLSLFFIPLDRSHPGLAVKRISKMGSRAVDANEVFFDDYPVPADSLIGEEGQGFRIVLHGMNAERCLLAGEALGLGYAALEKAAAYARDRNVFGRPIGMNQGIAHPLADVYMRLEAAQLATYHATKLYDETEGDEKAGKEVGVACNMAKYLAAEAAFAACERAVLTHGGMGYAAEYDVERWFRDSLIPRIAPVSREMILNFVGEKALGLPKSY